MIERRKFRTKEAQKRERLRLIFRLVVICLCIFSGISIVAYVSRIGSLRITAVQVTTDGVLPREELAAAIQANMQSTYIGLIPKDTAARVSHAELEKLILTNYPRVSSIHISRTGLRELHAAVQERTPKALWCGDVIPPVAQEKTTDEERITEGVWGTCYLIDEVGYMYAKAPLFSGTMYPRYYGSLEKADPIGQQYLPAEEFKKWQDFYTTLQFKDVTPQAILFIDEQDVEMYLTNGLRLLLPRNEEVEVIERRLFALLDSEAIDVEKKVEYIDLRFGTKAFVRYYEVEKANEPNI